MRAPEGLHIQMFSLHGLIRGENIELGLDADTGGQISYVVDLGRNLSNLPGVERVDLFTRLIQDKSVSADYGQEFEQVTDRFRIVRIQCGGRKYLRKELLWPHLDEYVDKTIKFIKKTQRLGHIVHGHYADAGYGARQISEFFGLPLVFTGHSLGRVKQQRLLDEGMDPRELVRRYRIDHRIAIEEEVIRAADLIVTSTRQEIEAQYGMYHNGSLPRFQVIPPGVDIDKFSPYYHNLLPKQNMDEPAKYAYASAVSDLNRFFKNPDKPLILALCRPDKRKNISGLIHAFGTDLELQTMANLAIFAGIRKDISVMEENERDVLTEMLLLMDKYDLYGKMAIPKKHDFDHEVPELYRIAAERQGVFVNVALPDPFGLTLSEAAACGLPLVATNDGGPRDIIDNCQNGILVDPTDTTAISTAIKKIIADEALWRIYSHNGTNNVRVHYTWEAHVGQYLSQIGGLAGEDNGDFDAGVPGNAIGKRLTRLRHLVVSDIDNTLIGRDNVQLPELIRLLNEHHERVGFCVATGRSIDSAREFLARYKLPQPDVIIASVGAEIYYGGDLLYEKGWDTHISHRWNRERLREILDGIDFLTLQEEQTQRPYKLSYYMEPAKDRIAHIHDLLLRSRLRYNLIYSHNQFLDVLPYRASKGKAIRYLSYKWEIPLDNILVCGDSGNDEEMLRGEPLAVVVGNFSAELERLRGLRHVYFAQAECAGGILEGLRHYGFFEKTDPQGEA